MLVYTETIVYKKTKTFIKCRHEYIAYKTKYVNLIKLKGITQGKTSFVNKKCFVHFIEINSDGFVFQSKSVLSTFTRVGI